MKKSFFVSLFIFVGVFSFGQAHAFSIYDQADATSSHNYSVANGSGVNYFLNSGISSGFTITSVAMKYSLTTVGGCTPGQAGLEITPSGNELEENGRPNLIADGATHYLVFDTLRVGGVFSPLALSGAQFNQTVDLFMFGWGTCTGTLTVFDGTTNNTYIGNWGGSNTGFYPHIIFNGLNPYSVDFGTNMASGFTSPVFSFWSLSVTAPVYQNNVTASVVWQGNSTTTLGYAGVDTFKMACCTALNSAIIEPKVSQYLIAGDYTATAILSNPAGILATSSLISFTVTATGTPVTYVGNTTASSTNPFTSGSALWNTDWCPDTSFSVWGADFGKGICVVFSFLFVPGQDAYNQFVNLQSTMQSHAPFSYFYDVSTSLTNIVPTSTALSVLNINTGTSTPIQVNVDLLSSATMDKYTTPTSRTVVRTLIQYSLYLAFIGMIILEVRKLFKGGGK